jgi:hypothetical protein
MRRNVADAFSLPETRDKPSFMGDAPCEVCTAVFRAFGDQELVHIAAGALCGERRSRRNRVQSRLRHYCSGFGGDGKRMKCAATQSHRPFRRA